MSSIKYQKVYDRMTEKQKQTMADLYMKGINHDGHSWNTYGDIEDAVADLLEENGMRKETTNGGYECFHCGQKSVYWSGDFNFEDYGLEGEGIIHECHCSNCGAEIIYKIPIPNESEEENGNEKHNT